MARKPAAAKSSTKIVASHAIEKIIRSRENANGQLEYLIKWKDFPESENSWQSINDLYSVRKSPPCASPDVDMNDGILVHDSSDEQNSNASETNEPLSRETASPSTSIVDVESTENESAVSAPVQKKQQRTNKNGQDEPSPKRRRPNRRENVAQPMLNEPTLNEQQQQTPKSRGRPKMIANVRTEHDSVMETEQQQPKNGQEQEQQQPKKRRQRKSNAVVADKEKSGSDAAAGAAAVADADDQRTIEHVEKMRKRNNRHEYLVTWTAGDNAEWIGRDIMITKYAPHLIAYFERITRFDQLTKQIIRKQ